MARFVNKIVLRTSRKVSLLPDVPAEKWSEISHVISMCDTLIFFSLLP